MGHAERRPGDAQRGDDSARIVAHRDRHAAHLAVEFFVVDGVALLGDPLQLATQGGLVGMSGLGVDLERLVGVELAKGESKGVSP
jgi:hypothetical protein